MPVLAAAVFFTWIAVATWAGPITALWLGGAFAFLAAEVYTLRDGVPANTLSGHIYRWARSRWSRAALLAVILFWLAYHWTCSGAMPR